LDQLTSAEGSALTGHSSLTVDPALCSTSRRYPTNTRGAAAATHTDMRTPVQNATARLITGTRRSDHTSPVLRELHWLLIRERVKFKVACLIRQSLSGQAPLYLADDWRLVSDSTRRSLRSTDVSTCVVPRTLNSYGDRTFAAERPRLWNSLHIQLRNPDITYGLFRRQLKGHIFREA